MKQLEIISVEFKEVESQLTKKQYDAGADHILFRPVIKVKIAWDFFTDTHRIVIGENIIKRKITYFQLASYNVVQDWMAMECSDLLKTAKIENPKLYLIE